MKVDKLSALVPHLQQPRDQLLANTGDFYFSNASRQQPRSACIPRIPEIEMITESN